VLSFPLCPLLCSQCFILASPLFSSSLFSSSHLLISFHLFLSLLLSSPLLPFYFPNSSLSQIISRAISENQASPIITVTPDYKLQQIIATLPNIDEDPLFDLSLAILPSEGTSLRFSSHPSLLFSSLLFSSLLFSFL